MDTLMTETANWTRLRVSQIKGRSLETNGREDMMKIKCALCDCVDWMEQWQLPACISQPTNDDIWTRGGRA